MTVFKALIAGSIAAGSMALLAGTASAATLPVPAKPAFATQLDIDGAEVELVQHRRWDRGRHGNRYRARRPGYHHYHGGYWYRTPWWTLPLVVPPVVAPIVPAPAPVYGANAHVQWCLGRYRSYNPQTDQFLGYDGYYHYCRSPYR